MDLKEKQVIIDSALSLIYVDYPNTVLFNRVFKAISLRFNISEDQLKRLLNEYQDLGLVSIGLSDNLEDGLRVGLTSESLRILNNHPDYLSFLELNHQHQVSEQKQTKRKNRLQFISICIAVAAFGFSIFCYFDSRSSDQKIKQLENRIKTLEASSL